MEVYETLEPLMKDFRKLRLQHAGEWSVPNRRRQLSLFSDNHR